MHCIVVHRAGGYERLSYEERPDPVPRTGEVLVDCAAAGVNYADCIVRMGLYSSAKEYVGWPITPGFEFAGRVAAVGDGVSDVEVGREVFGVTRFGGYASRVAVPRAQVFDRPPKLDVHAAAAFPTVSLTAWYALHELVRARRGMRLLVHSAAGGVGGALVQLGRIAGCTVVAVVGAAHKVHLARELGADHVVDKSHEDLWTAVERHAPDGFDAVLDANGVATLRGSYAHLAPEGKLIVYGFHSMLPRGRGRPGKLRLLWNYVRTPRFDPIDLTQRNRGVLGFNLSYLFHRRDFLSAAMEELMGLWNAGALRSPPVAAHPLADAAGAHRALESGRTTGKLVLLP